MLDQLLPQLIAQLQTEHKQLTLMMIDLDYFKNLNDTLGHAAGDELLKSIGQIIHSTIRDGRFRIPLWRRRICPPFARLRSGRCHPDRRKARVIGQAHWAKHTNWPSPQLTFGISTIAELPQPTAAALLKRADDRLYEAKAKRGQPAPAATEAA